MGDWFFGLMSEESKAMRLSSILPPAARAAVAAAALAGCASSAPRLHQPDRIEAFCGDRVALITAIESIVTSTDDAPGASAVPPPAAIAKTVKDGGGVIAHWNDQPLYLPAVAKAVDAAGDYVTLGDVAIGPPPDSGSSRPIYLTVKSKAGPRTFTLQAYDVQDVCNEGKLKS